MKISIALLRVVFTILSVCFMTAFICSFPIGTPFQKVLLGIGFGTLFSAVLLSLELLLRRYSLKAFNTVALGLLFGYLMGHALTAICRAIFEIAHAHTFLQPQAIDLIQFCIFLVGTYLGTVLTIRFSDEIFLSIPFFKLDQAKQRKRDFILDASTLADPRIIDLAATGILDNAAIIPRFIENDLASKAEVGDEGDKAKARRCLDTIKTLEHLPHFGLRFDETQFPDLPDSFSQILRLARLCDSSILTANHSHTHQFPMEGVSILNLHALSHALKPLMVQGESITIKIQRYGKESNQGVGYLEDGTMVVINGGGDYIGESIKVTVLSVKHTSSGRMIFCNAIDHPSSKEKHAKV